MIENFLTALEQTSLAVSIAESAWLFPILESIHVLALAIVLGSIVMVDLRLVNVVLRHRNVAELTNETLPWTWAGFVVAAITGLLMFASSATRYWDLTPFRIKMLLLVLAGINMLVFHFRTFRDVSLWGSAARTPVGAQIAGILSLVLWVSIVTFGRWIGFV